MPKIDKNGNFTKFQGVTVISPVSEGEDSANLENLYYYLSANNLIINNFALLPFDSLHMTVNNLYVAESESNWNEFIDNNLNFFKSLTFMLKNQKGFEATVESNVIVGDVIQLVLDLSNHLKARLHSFGSSFGIHDLKPYLFHITLGYRYKDISLEDLALIKNHVQEAISTFFGQSKKLSFQAPRLTYFNDMTKFIDWNGQSNPFKENINRLFTAKRYRPEDHLDLQMENQEKISARPTKRYKED